MHLTDQLRYRRDELELLLQQSRVAESVDPAEAIADQVVLVVVRDINA